MMRHPSFHSADDGDSFAYRVPTPQSGPSVSIAQCVNLAIRNELPTIERLSLSTEVDLDEIPGEPANPQSQQVIHRFLHRLIESAKPSSHLAITLINGNAQWELEVAAEFEVSDSNTMMRSRHEIPASPPASEELRRIAFECGGELEQWDCPQGGQAVVLVVAKNRRQAAEYRADRRAG